MKKEIVILGGGPSGLSAAWALSKQGFNVTIIEKEAQVGGLCRTISYRDTRRQEDYRFDLGGHRFISRNKNLIQSIFDLMGEELLCLNRKSAIRLQGQSYRYPLSFSDIVTKMNPGLSLRAIADYLKITLSPGINRRSGTSFEAWVLQRFGRTLYEIFFRDYTEKVWGLRPDGLSADWAVQRIPVLNFRDILRELAGGTKRKHEAYAKQFYYPKRGIGQIFEWIAEETLKNGAVIHLNAKATALSIENHVIKGLSFIKGNHLESIDCDYLISTIPLPELAAMVAPDSPSKSLTHSKLRFRSVRFLNMLIDQPMISENTWTYVPESKYMMTRIQEPKLRSPFNAPAGKTSLMLEIPCNYRDATWCVDEKTLFKRVIKDLSDLDIHVGPHVMDYFSTYARHGYPVYHLGYREAVSGLLQQIEPCRNLITTGRQGLFRYIFMDQAMLMGRHAAQRIIAGKLDEGQREEIGLEKELFEEKAVSL